LTIDYLVSSTATTARRYAATNHLQDTVYCKCSKIDVERNEVALSLLWDLDTRNHEVTLLKIKHIRLREAWRWRGIVKVDSKTTWFITQTVHSDYMKTILLTASIVIASVAIGLFVVVAAVSTALAAQEHPSTIVRPSGPTLHPQNINFKPPVCAALNRC
jgi:hypothetical protein